ncbi:TPA: hypothetical protein ACKRM8_006295, partial [Pseudomonas aeruginosa]
VQVNGQPAKPAREVGAGDVVSIRKEDPAVHVRVVAVSGVRGPAPAARQLYEETPESVAARERAQPQMHDAGAQGAAVVGRPRHAGRQRLQARRMQPDGRRGYQFHNVPSCCSRFTGR